MFTKSRKDKLVEQAQDLAHDLSEKIAPAVEKAREEVAPRVADARDQLAPKVAGLRDQLDAKVTPTLEQARDRVQGNVHHYVADARQQAQSLRDEAERRGTAAAAALKGEDVKKPAGKGKKLLVLAALVGAGVVVARQLAGGQQDNWQSSYTPSPAPTGSTPGESIADSAEQPHPVTTPDDPAERVDLDSSADGTDATSAASSDPNTK